MTTSAQTRSGLDFVEGFASAAERFAVSVARADLRAPVPTCPGWSVYDLVTHLGNVHAWAATIVETGKPAPDQNDEPSHRRPKTAAEWYAGKAEDLYEVLRLCDPASRCWNFAFGSGTASFWQRRQLHETTVHGVDLTLALGQVPDLSSEVSADGVDEALRVFLHRMHMRGHPADLSRPITIVATDVDRAWTVCPSRMTQGVPSQQPAPPEVHDGAALPAGRGEAQERVEGPAAALYALLWKRLPATDASLSFSGDQGRIDRFLASRLTA